MGYEKAEFLVVAILIPIRFLCSAFTAQYSSIDPSQYAYYHDWYFSSSSFASSIIQSLGMGCLIALLVGFYSPELARSWEKGLAIDMPRQLMCAFLMLVIFVFYFSVLEQLFPMFFGVFIPKQEWMSPTNAYERLQAFVIALINGPAEEFLRVYFIARIKSLTKNSMFAVLSSAFIFSIYHFAYGWATVGYFFVIGVFCGGLYLRKNYLLTLVAWHILADMTGMIYLTEWRAFMAFFGISWF